jgi:spore coat protein CotF
MASFFGNKAKESMNLSDEIIAKNMIFSSSGGATAYFNALMASSTPEIKAMYAANMNQIIGGHSALIELSVNRQWGNPYTSPKDQLSNVYSKTMQQIHQ